MLRFHHGCFGLAHVAEGLAAGGWLEGGLAARCLLSAGLAHEDICVVVEHDAALGLMKVA